MRPPPLSRDGARRMVAGALGGADAAFGDACWRMTEGNVFLLEELIARRARRGLAADGAERGADRHARARGGAARGRRAAHAPVRRRRRRGARRRRARRRRPAAPCRRAGRSAAERVAAAADALAASDILRPVDPGALRFAHPLLASAVYADIATGERAALHRRAAEILHAEGIAPERVAAHLLPSPGEGDAWVVDLLCDVARHAFAAGAPESAASYLCRALQEPPATEQRAAVLRALGASEAATGLPSAVEHLEEALTVSAGDRDRARTLLALGRALAAAGRHADALERFDEAAGCGDAAAGVAAQARAEAGVLGVLEPARRATLLAGAARRAAPPITAR